jgi:hypothetical protein
MTKMEFRLLLTVIDKMSPNGAEFDTRSLYLYILRQPSTFKTNFKLLSNDLNRLYRMQLLSRRRVKRPVYGGDGYRGFMYSYRLNKQGRSYIDYLKLTFFNSEVQDHLKRLMLHVKPQSAAEIDDTERSLGEKTDYLNEEYAEYFFLHSRSRKGRHKRFPLRIRFEFVEELMRRKRKLEQENASLKGELEDTRTKLKILMAKNLSQKP